ncbi:unnamed protein product [Arctia plantaginis]|uniref:unspecific monooxygenase n=1 Tax=Arctia plantaginis TaxID=874455 RepID=A0A8S0YNK4_ARCPL|nr:unnamed protein product [Arctia plantaginis]
MLSEILVALCVVLFVIWYKTNKNNYWKKRNILQIEDLNWIFMFSRSSLAEICKNIYDKYDTPYIGTSMGSTPTLILKNIEDIKAVLADDFSSFYSRGMQPHPNDILADNILFMNNLNRWKLIRHSIAPAFTSFRLKQMFYILEKCARDLVEVVEDNKHARKKPFSFLYTYTTASIGASIIGVDIQAKNSEMDSPFLDMSWELLKPSLKTKIRIFIANKFPKLFKALKLKIFGEHEKFFISMLKSFMENRRRHFRITHDFVEICLQLQYKGMMQDFFTTCEITPTTERLAAQAFAFFIAGADTTANALHFTLIELSNNKHILEKLHEEIDGVFGTYKEELSYNDIEKLEYLDMIISESLRMNPPIGFIQRICTKDTVLPSNVAIEEGTAVVIPIFAIHRDDKYFSVPDLFEPERFCKDSISEMKYMYLPFSEGNRNCIGLEMARLTMKVGLAWLLRRFTLAEQIYKPKFERHSFALRASKAYYKLIVRDLCPE